MGDTTHTEKTIFDADSFEVCGRANLELALQVVEDAAAYEPPGKLRRVQLDNAAATIRELLNPNGYYYHA